MWKIVMLIVFLLTVSTAHGQLMNIQPTNVSITLTAIFSLTDVVMNPPSPTQEQSVDITVAYENVGNLPVVAQPHVNITNSTGDVIAEIMFISFPVAVSEKNNITNFSGWNTNAHPIDCYNMTATANYENVTNKTTSTLTKGFCIAAKSTPPPGGNGGGGGPAPTTPPPTTVAATPPPEPCIKDRFNVLGPELARCILEELQLTTTIFYVVPDTLAGPAAASDKYTMPSDPFVRGGLPSPLEVTPVSIYEEAVSIVLQRFNNASTVLLARGDLAVDSMAAVAFAKAGHMPILLTEPGELPDVTLNALMLLGPSNIIIVGGEVAVSRDVESELSEHWDVWRIWGESRYETAVELASLIKDPEVVVVTDGNKPSVDAILVSAEYQAPLLYVNGEVVPQAVRKYLLEHRETSTGENLKVVAVGVEKKALIEVQGLVTLPKFLVEIEVFSRLYQVIMGIVS